MSLNGHVWIRMRLGQPAVELDSWHALNGQDCPEGLTEDSANQVCSILNAYIPKEYSTRGTRYHVLNRYPSGALYFHLLNRPTTL
jgi:hypothetical protein